MNGYAAFPKSFIDDMPSLSSSAICVYLFLYCSATFKGKKKGQWAGSIRDISAGAGLHKDAVLKGLKELQDAQKILYLPTKSRHTLSLFIVTAFRTAKDYGKVIHNVDNSKSYYPGKRDDKGDDKPVYHPAKRHDKALDRPKKRDDNTPQTHTTQALSPPEEVLHEEVLLGRSGSTPQGGRKRPLSNPKTPQNQSGARTGTVISLAQALQNSLDTLRRNP